MKTNKPSSVAETLRKARKLIEHPNHWTKGAFARSFIFNNKCEPDSMFAGSFCALGALYKVDGPYEYDAIDALARVISSDVNERRPAHRYYVYRYNDRETTTHADILDLFDKAIEQEEKNGV